MSSRSMFTSSRSPATGASPRQSVRVDDSPITEFVKVIDNTPQGAWQKRTTAFENLVKQVPEGSDYYTQPAAWYNNPPTLRHLANPLSGLLKDPRSTVVKRTCGSLLSLFSRCQSDARYLFKDMMATVLSVHAQTVQVIRQAVQFMVMEAIPEVPCKMVMPLWMERLKIDKSRTVRDACALYLGQALMSWTDDGYLSEEIWMQVGKCLVSSLRDPSPAVRTNIKAALETMQRMQPVYFDNLMNDPDGPAAKDAKLAKWLGNLGQGGNPDTEELSVMSRISYNSDIRTSRRVGSSGASVGSQTPRRGGPGGGGGRDNAVPSSIALGRRASPVNLPPSSGSVTSTKSNSRIAPPSASRRSDMMSRRDRQEPATPSPMKSPPPTLPSPGSPITPEDGNLDDAIAAADGAGGDNNNKDPSAFPADLGVPALRESMQDSSPKKSGRSHSMNVASNADRPAADRSSSEGDVLSHRRNRNSVLIQQRLKMSSSSQLDHADEDVDDEYKNGGGGENGNGVVKPPKFPSGKNAETAPMAAVAAALPSSPSAIPPPEHMVIAIRLLKAHKAHVDAIMETLRIEMDTLRDFDRLLEEPGRPTEDEVLDYFESVGLCLEQRTVAGVQMQEELDRVSRGEPPNE